MIEPSKAAPLGARPSWGVAALLLATSDALAARFGAVAVRGELSGFTRASSGHCYFSLKDSDGAPALLRCAMFRRVAALVDFPVADGQQVELRGRLGVFEARGELQMVVESMQRVGTGSLYEEFLRRRAKLAEQGLFDPQRKRPLPTHPSCLGVITSPGAAALADVLTTVRRRSPHVRVVIYPSLVQGADAPASLVRALQAAAQHQQAQTLLLVRGGGSLEDLWAFNDERLVRAVAASPIPVVCGVGHETDVSLADLAADLRAPTPTAAAELAAPAQRDALAQLEALAAAATRALTRALQAHAQRLDMMAARLGQPGRALLQQGQRLDDLARRSQRSLVAGCQGQRQHLLRQQSRTQRAVAVGLARERSRLASAAQALQAHDPKRVLQRGYAWIEDERGAPVISVRELTPGQAVKAVWADGLARAVIQSLESPQ